MKAVRYTLVSDGPTDANLIPIIDWTLKQTGGVDLSEGVRAEFWKLPKEPKGLVARLLGAIDLHPCDILFVHRDAEKEPPNNRFEEIKAAFSEFNKQSGKLPAVAVIPVRMLEAWLTFNEQAIRRAAGNPNGTVSLGLPPLKRIESRPDPKADLKKAILAASELSGRRLKKFDDAAAFWQIVDHIDDFAPLRQLSGFQNFENSIRQLKTNGWAAGFYG